MRTWLFAWVAAAAWTVLLHKVRHVRREPHNVFLRSFCLTTFFVALSFTVALPPLLSRIEQTTGILSIWYTGIIIAGTPFGLTTFLLWNHEPAAAWQRIRPHIPFYTAALICMVALDLRGAVNPTQVNISAHAQAPELLYGVTAYVRDAMLIFAVGDGYSAGYVSYLTWNQAAAVDRPWLRRGLRTLATAAAMILLMCVNVIAVLLALRLNSKAFAFEFLTTALGGLSILVGATGATMPIWGPQIDRMIAYRRLYPLWLAVHRAFPQLILDPPRWPWLDRWNPWNINYRLYRRTIEIRDGWLALRPHTSKGVADRARERAQRAGLAGIDQRAMITAHTIAAAVQSHSQSQKPGDEPAPVDALGGDELTIETQWLVKVACAYQQSSCKLEP